LYPIGTVCKSDYPGIFICKTNPRMWNETTIVIDNQNNITRTIYAPKVFKKEWAEIIGYKPQVGDKFEIPKRDMDVLHHHTNEKIFTVIKFTGSWDNPNSVITFKAKKPLGLDGEQTVLLKNIKIIK